MTRKTYKTAQGVAIDMDQLRLLNERVVSVGNMGVNARGDQVHPDGSVKEDRNTIMKKTYRTNSTVAGKGIVNSRGEFNASNVPAKTAESNVSSRRSTATTVESGTRTETTPAIMRGSLAQAIIGTDTTPAEENTATDDIFAPSNNTRTITRI
jgi:hypothetical protein